MTTVFCLTKAWIQTKYYLVCFTLPHFSQVIHEHSNYRLELHLSKMRMIPKAFTPRRSAKSEEHFPQAFATESMETLMIFSGR
jgi:hypothetical protein